MRHRVTSAPWGLIVPVLVLVAGAQLEIVSRSLEGSRPLLVAIALVYSLALLAATRVPLVAVAIAFGALGLMALVARSATNEAAAPMFAGLAGAFLVARYGMGRQPLAGLAIALVTVVLVARDQPSFAGAFATFAITAVLVAVTWGTGVALRGREQHAAAAESRAEHAEAEREATARLAVAEERARIARELHDIVAHSVSVMVLKAGAVRHRLPDTLAADKDALRDVEAAGREALTEMRQLLGAMRPDDDHAERAPQPSIDGVRRLVDEVSPCRAGRQPRHRRPASPAVARDRAVRVSHRAGRADERAPARQGATRRRPPPLRRRCAVHRGARRRAHIGRRRRSGPRAHRGARAREGVRR